MFSSKIQLLFITTASLCILSVSGRLALNGALKNVIDQINSGGALEGIIGPDGALKNVIDQLNSGGALEGIIGPGGTLEGILGPGGPLEGMLGPGGPFEGFLGPGGAEIIESLMSSSGPIKDILGKINLSNVLEGPLSNLLGEEGLFGSLLNMDDLLDGLSSMDNPLGNILGPDGPLGNIMDSINRKSGSDLLSGLVPTLLDPEGGLLVKASGMLRRKQDGELELSGKSGEKHGGGKKGRGRGRGGDSVFEARLGL